MADIQRILFPYDFSLQATQAVPVVRAFATRLGARITLMSIVPPVWSPAPAGMHLHDDQDQAHRASELESHLAQALVTELNGLPVDRVTDVGDPAFRITEFAHANAIQLIMMPTHGLGLARSLLVGSATATVLHDAHCPVWTAAEVETPGTADVPRTILCALDSTPEAARLLHWAAAFGRSVGATLRLLHVVGPISDWPALRSERALQDRVREEARVAVDAVVQSVGVDAPVRVAVGEVVKTVAEEARQERADLLIIGRGALTSSLGRLRTHAYGIIQSAPCPVISV